MNPEAPGLEHKPRLAAKAKLRLDPKTQRYILLYPEKGLLLNATGAAILQRCSGQAPLAAIVRELALEFHSDPDVLQIEVLAFVRGLVERGLLELLP